MLWYNSTMKKTSIPIPSSHTYRILVFLAGIIATVAYRAIIIVGHYSQTWTDIIWYIGTIGFVWYFGHRYNIEKKRDRIILEHKLIEKVNRNKEFKEVDREALAYTLKSLASSKSSWNYIAIFVASGIALLYDICLKLFFSN
jgi:hypothetical protein